MDATDTLHERVRNLGLRHRGPKLLIEFIIIGGGIGGLACAYTLARSGHVVRVLEKCSGRSQRSGGILVPPNLTKILLEWGLYEELAMAPRCRKSQFYSFHTGELIGLLEWQEDIIHEAGAEFLLMHHDDLHQALYKKAVSAGARVTFNASVREVHFNQQKRQPTVILEDGTELVADVVVGADGYRSVTRSVVAPEADAGIDTQHSFYTITVPTSEMQDDPELRKLAERSEWPIWMGNSCSALGYPIRDGKEYSLHVYWPDDKLRQSTPVEERWDVTVPTDIIDLGDFDPRVRKLFKLAPNALRIQYVQRDIAEDWVDESGRIVLVGEAAHPLMPCTMHGPSLAVEDAAVLGALMSRLSAKEQIPQLLDAFQEIRQDRCIRVHGSELRNAELVTLPPGKECDMRNAGMSLSLQTMNTKWDDTRLREQWDEIGGVFGYNAHEAAEDWWVKWGALGSAEHSIREPLDLVFVEIAVSEV